MPKRSGRRSSTPRHESFHLQVDDCEPAYSFARSDFSHQPGPYWEHLGITLTGTLLAPERVKGRRVSAVFLGNRDDQRMLEESPKSDWKPPHVGVLTLRGERSDFLGSLPHDAVWQLAHAFAGGALRIVSFHGIRHRGGRNDIRSIHFARAAELDDA